MSGEFLLVLIVAGSYLAAHWAFEWLGHRYMLVSGAEYLLLGILLGEQIVPVGRKLIVGTSIGAAWRQARCGQHVFGALPGSHAQPVDTTSNARIGEVQS